MERSRLRGETFKDKVPSAQRFLKGSSRHLVLNAAGVRMIKGMGKKQGRATGKKEKIRGVRISWGHQGMGQEQGILRIIIR